MKASFRALGRDPVGCSALALASPARSRSSRARARSPPTRREGRGRASDRQARLGRIQARGPDRREDQEGRADQLRVLLSGLRHSAVLAAIQGGLRDGLQDGQSHLSHELRRHRAGPERSEPAGEPDRGEARGRRDRLHRHRAGELRRHDRHHQQAHGSRHSGVHRRRDLARTRVHQLHPDPRQGGQDRGRDRAQVDQGQQQDRHQGVRRVRRRSDAVLGARAA